MLALEVYGTGLRTVLAHFLHEVHTLAGDQLVEVIFDDAVAVEIDFMAVGAGDDAVVLLGNNVHDDAVRQRLMRLDLAALLADIVFELAARIVKRVANRNIDVFMRLVEGKDR